MPIKHLSNRSNKGSSFQLFSTFDDLELLIRLINQWIYESLISLISSEIK